MAHRFVLDGGPERANQDVGLREQAIDAGREVDLAVRLVAHADHHALDSGRLGEERHREVVGVATQHGHDDVGASDLRFLEERGFRGVARERDEPELLRGALRDGAIAIQDRDVVAGTAQVLGDVETRPAHADNQHSHDLVAAFLPGRSGQHELPVDHVDARGGRLVGDEPAASGVEQRRLLRRQNRDVRERVAHHLPRGASEL